MHHFMTGIARARFGAGAGEWRPELGAQELRGAREGPISVEPDDFVGDFE